MTSLDLVTPRLYLAISEVTVSSGKIVRRNVTKVLGMSLRTDFSSSILGIVHSGFCLVCCWFCCLLWAVRCRVDE